MPPSVPCSVHVGGQGAIRELRHEIAIMSHMHHPRVVQFLGACTRNQPWLIMFEYMPGGALSTLLGAARRPGGGGGRNRMRRCRGTSIGGDDRPSPSLPPADSCRFSPVPLALDD